MPNYRFVKFAVVAIGLVLLALLASTVGTLAEAASFIDANTNHRHRNSQSGYKSNHIIHSHHRRKNSSKKNRMVCKPSSESFWIRNECHEGFLAIISDRRVVTVNTAINEHDSTGKISHYSKSQIFVQKCQKFNFDKPQHLSLHSRLLHTVAGNGHIW